MKVLVAGSGGREHAISWKLAQSANVDEVICVPGNGGTANEQKCVNMQIDGLSTVDAVLVASQTEKPDFVVIGPEDPLCAGVADALWQNGFCTVGACKNAAMLEGSKDFAKSFMQKYGVASAQSKTFTDANLAIDYINAHGAPIVVKADGLAAGKGVVVAPTVDVAVKAVKDFMQDGTLGKAGATVVLEDYLQGVEISVLAGVSVTPKLASQNKALIVPFVPARDHKRLKDGAKGPNTGGMGAVAPLADVSDEQMAQFNKDILLPTLNGLIKEQFDYRGFIFFGVMLCKDGPKLLEYNVRLGDPETQAVLPLMDFDFADLCLAITDPKEEGTLKDFATNIKWKDGFVCAPVAVSGGYPGKYGKGYTITMQDMPKDAKVFVAGATMQQNDDGAKLVTSGGRVLAASGFGATFEEARKVAYDALSAINFDGMEYRSDIGLPGAAESGEL